MQLVFSPFRLLGGSSDTGRSTYAEAFFYFALHILPIPRLSSRLTKTTLQQFAIDIGLFFNDLELLEPYFPRLTPQITPQFSFHCLSNIMLFTPPRYSQLSAASYDAYLHLLCILLASVPDPTRQGSDDNEQIGSWTDFSRKIDHDTAVVPTDLDTKTRTRLNSILSTEHVSKLLKAADCSSKLLSLVTHLPLLCWSWPSQSCNALNAVIMGEATPFAKTLYSEKVSDMPLGKNVAMNSIKMIGMLISTSDSPILKHFILGSRSFEHWARLLFFTDLFMLLNQRMNDKEFYTSSPSDLESDLHNPLGVDQFRGFLKHLCSIVYFLDRLPAVGNHAPVARGRIDWKGLTARLNGSLLTLYCRE